jgi:chromosome segregation ATPase
MSETTYTGTGQKPGLPSREETTTAVSGVVSADKLIADLRAELAEMTADRDSECRWAAEYLGDLTDTQAELAAAQAELATLKVQYDLAYELAMDEREDRKKARAEVERLQKEMDGIVSLDELMVEKCQQIKAENARLRAELDKTHDAIRYTLAQLEYMRMLWGGEGVTDGIAIRLREALEGGAQ